MGLHGWGVLYWKPQRQACQGRQLWQRQHCRLACVLPQLAVKPPDNALGNHGLELAGVSPHELVDLLPVEVGLGWLQSD